LADVTEPACDVRGIMDSDRAGMSVPSQRQGVAVGKTLVLVALGVIALIVDGMVVVSVVGALVKFAFYLLIGAAVVGGGLYLVARARRAVRGNRFRQIR